MKVALDYCIRVGDALVDSKTIGDKLDAYRDQIMGEPIVEGTLLLILDGTPYGGDLVDPIFRLGGQWIRKLPWILTGDTETVAYRNSEHCVAFVPAGESIEVSLFTGSENEVEEYLVEPSTVRLDAFAKELIRLVERLVELARALSPSLLETNEDCRELVASLDEGRKAWRDYQVHNRR